MFTVPVDDGMVVEVGEVAEVVEVSVVEVWVVVRSLVVVVEVVVVEVVEVGAVETGVLLCVVDVKTSWAGPASEPTATNPSTPFTPGRLGATVVGGVVATGLVCVAFRAPSISGPVGRSDVEGKDVVLAADVTVVAELMLAACCPAVEGDVGGLAVMDATVAGVWPAVGTVVRWWTVVEVSGGKVEPSGTSVDGNILLSSVTCTVIPSGASVPGPAVKASPIVVNS